MRKFLPLLFALSIIILPIMFAPSCANTTEAPTGGIKDSIPPYIIDINPLPRATGVPVEGVKFIFTFNEYVTLKTPSNIILSPPQDKPLKLRLSGKSVIASTEEALAPNTTYTISFTDAIVDANEGNTFAGYTYVFSTGTQIDTMLLTGTVQDCNTLNPIKGATVILHKDLSDSAVFKTKPYAVTKTDDWGYFAIPYIKDSCYRLYAIKDANNNNIYDPETEIIGFADSLVRPVMIANDTVKEMLRYDMLDTLSCLARKSEYEINLFREKPAKQYVVNKVRTAERSAYITFMAPGAWIDSLWVRGFRSNQIITQFNIEQDSLELWINSRRAAPDTMNVFINYRKTDSLGRLEATQERIKLAMPNDKRTYSKKSRRSISASDTTCTFKIQATPETVEQEGCIIEFSLPIINKDFEKVRMTSINPRQKEEIEEYTVLQDSLNLRKYILRPKSKFLPGYQYIIKFAQDAFRDINGFNSDSTQIKFALPTDDKLSTIHAQMTGVDRKVIVDLQNERDNKVLRSFVIDSDCTLVFPYLRTGTYKIRITEDSNRNSIIDTGSVLEQRQPERVKYYEQNGNKYIQIPLASDVNQTINIENMFKR